MRKSITALTPIRKSLLYTQVGLAISTGISQNILSRIETGKQNPTEDQAARIATALGIPIDHIFTVVE